MDLFVNVSSSVATIISHFLSLQYTVQFLLSHAQKFWRSPVDHVGGRQEKEEEEILINVLSLLVHYSNGLQWPFQNRA